jgi:formylglycine-generating enzyme
MAPSPGNDTQRGAPRSGENMARVPGGGFLMGSEDFYPEERPVRRVEVDGFWMDTHPVTVADFRHFVMATGYVTVAERPLDPREYPDADPALLHPGSLVFRSPRGPVDLDDPTQWWRYIPGANWHHPRGPDSTTDGLDRHPVTHVAAEDADVFAGWAGKDLPTEAEWESLVPGQPGAHIPRRVIKGGSHLCAPNYCLRYRPAARQGEAVDTSTAHLGFRCIVRDTTVVSR